jgi:cobalt-zinc-cadmium efflux system protein
MDPTRDPTCAHFEPDCRNRHAPLGPAEHAHEPRHLHPSPHTHSVHGVEGHRPLQRRALFLSLVLTGAAMGLELVGGILTGSLMLLSDAVHMLSHAVALAVSYLAIRMATRPRTPRSHYGLFRAEILASLLNGLGLLALCAWIVAESIARLRAPEPIQGLEMLVVAAIGLVINVATAWILARSGAEDLNTRSALLHMVGDLLSSVVVVLGGLVLIGTGWTWIDPVLSLLVAALMLVWSFGLVRSSCSVLLERAPESVEPHEVLQALKAEPGVRDVHDLHVWEITSGYVCLTAHVVVDDGPVSQAERLQESMRELLWKRFRVAHATLQLEACA